MKSLLFLYFIGIQSSIKNTPDEMDHYRSPLKELLLVVGLFINLVVLTFLHKFGVWQWLMANWPYEYGRAHSKNFIAPSGILAILVMGSLWFTLKKYFLREKVKQHIFAVFDNPLGKKNAEKHELIPIYLVFFNTFAGAMFAGGYWIVFGLCICVWAGLEIWVRKTFYSGENTSYKDSRSKLNNINL